MQSLYPPIEPYRIHRLQVSSQHTLHVEQSGNPSAIPILFLHGGPGAGSTENHRRYFDPARYHIINFDQRGAHRSSPAGCIEENTTAHLLADIEQIREQLGIERWGIFGGSWGATLGLLYAQRHPEHVLGMIVRGVFLARQTDRAWYFEDGASRILPEAWQQFRDYVGPSADTVHAYHALIHGVDKQTSLEAARCWAAWTSCVVGWHLGWKGVDPGLKPDQMLNEVRIESHYAKHDYFIRENEIIENCALIPDVPIRIIHGRRDLTCTPDAAWLLHKALPSSSLQILPEGGHLASEPVMVDALVNATDAMANELAP